MPASSRAISSPIPSATPDMIGISSTAQTTTDGETDAFADILQAQLSHFEEKPSLLLPGLLPIPESTGIPQDAPVAVHPDVLALLIGSNFPPTDIKDQQAIEISGKRMADAQINTTAMPLSDSLLSSPPVSLTTTPVTIESTGSLQIKDSLEKPTQGHEITGEDQPPAIHATTTPDFPVPPQGLPINTATSPTRHADLLNNPVADQPDRTITAAKEGSSDSMARINPAMNGSSTFQPGTADFAALSIRGTDQPPPPLGQEASVTPNTSPAPQVLSPHHTNLTAGEGPYPALRQLTAIPIHTPAGTNGWSSEVADRLIWMSSNQQQRAELILNPPQLGRIEVSLSITSDQTEVMFISTNPTTREALESALPKLRDALADAGISLGQTHVGADSRREEMPQSANKQENKDNPGLFSQAGDTSIHANMLQQLGESGRIGHGNGLVNVFA